MADNIICFNVKAENACFADPITRVGGERFSYQVPTYSALKGICDNIYWKPTFKWEIKRVRVLNQIQYEQKSFLCPATLCGESESNKSDRAFALELCDVSYNVEAALVWDMDRPDLEQDRNLRKHMEIAKRSIAAGGRLPIYLGKKEGNCYAEVSPAVFCEGKGFYDEAGQYPCGMMLHGITYPTKGEHALKARFWTPVMKNGVIEFIRPDECTMVTHIKAAAPVRDGEIKSVDDEWLEVMTR